MLEHSENLVVGSKLLDCSLPLFDVWILEVTSNLLELFEFTQFTGFKDDWPLVLNIDSEFIVHIRPWSHSFSWRIVLERRLILGSLRPASILEPYVSHQLRLQVNHILHHAWLGSVIVSEHPI